MRKKTLPYILWAIGVIIILFVVFHFVADVPLKNFLKPKIVWMFEK